MDLVVEEDGEARPALTAAVDVPVAASLDPTMLRSFQERKLPNIEPLPVRRPASTDGAARSETDAPPQPSRGSKPDPASSAPLPWVSSPGRPVPPRKGLSAVPGERRQPPPVVVDVVLGAGDDDEEGVVIEIAKSTSRAPRTGTLSLILDGVSTGDLLVGEDDGALPHSVDDDMVVEVEEDLNPAR
jgi:hypothetical protein